MSHLSRRQFLNRSLLAAGGAFVIAGTKSSGRVIGANDTVRLGVAGLNGRGGSHVGEFAPMKGVEITYLIDPDTSTYAKRLDQLKKVTNGAGTAPKTVQDIRVALEDKELDAVSFATPNHWHALGTVWACQAGKDVYVEKPCSHNVHEGRVAVEAATKYGRIVQHGTQSRSNMAWAQAVEAVKSGRYGKLLVSRALCYKPRGSIGYQPTTATPASLDFSLWLGPAPEQPFHKNLVHYNWHWFWDFGNGDIGNQGVHQMDIARWLIPGATLPKSVASLGGRFGYSDQGETANTQVSVMDFGDAQLIFEVRGLKTGDYLGGKIGNFAHTDEGTITAARGGATFTPKGSDKAEPIKIEAKRGPSVGSKGDKHFSNFIAAVRSRETADLNAPILEGHYSAALCHLANISYRLGEQVSFQSKSRPFGSNEAGNETFARMEEHLSHENGVKLDGLAYQLGRKLTLDASKESFVGDDEANTFLTRAYRKPFEVPASLA